MSCSLTNTHPSSPFKNFTAPKSCLLRSLAFAILNMSCSYERKLRCLYII
ncbi:hypothetical protein Hanom_Chr13g01214701 [Helianthus anomalus]